MESPFPYDRLPTKKQFFGRDNELQKLELITSYANNLTIYSKRRMGKSSLIKYFLDNHQKEFITIYVDIFDITSKENFAYKLLNGISNIKQKDIKSAIKKLTSIFKRVRFEPTIDTQTLEYSIKPIVATLTFEEMMDDFFNYVNTLSKDKKVIIAIDEFQQIATIKDIKLDAYLREYIQQRVNTSYIFLGSKRHILRSLFEYKAPLFELSEPYELKPLKIDDIYNYAKKYLPISKEMIVYIYELSCAETKILQYILHLLYVYKVKNIDKQNIDNILTEIINAKDESFRIIYDTLNNNQKIALKMVGKYKQNIYNEDILRSYNIKKQTLQSAIKTLFKKELIDKDEDKYFIPDRSLELWVERLR